MHRRIPGLRDDALDALTRVTTGPATFRELRNVLERAAILSDGEYRMPALVSSAENAEGALSPPSDSEHRRGGARYQTRSARDRLEINRELRVASD